MNSNNPSSNNASSSSGRSGVAAPAQRPEPIRRLRGGELNQTQKDTTVNNIVRASPLTRWSAGELQTEQDAVLTEAEIAKNVLVDLIRGNAVLNMTQWLKEKGFQFDGTSLQEPGPLQSLILLWHYLLPRDRELLRLVKPWFLIVKAQPQAPKAEHSLALNDAGEVVSLVVLEAATGSFPFAVPTDFPEAFDDPLFQNKLKLPEYQAPYGTAWQGFQNPSVPPNPPFSPPPSDSTVFKAMLYDACTIAHELTHLRHSRMTNIFPSERTKAESFLRFRYLFANNINKLRIIGTNNIDPFERPLVATPRFEQRMEWSKPEKKRFLQPASTGSANLRDCYRALQAQLPFFGTDVGSEARSFIQGVCTRFRDVILIPDGNSPLFVDNLRTSMLQLGLFIPPNHPKITSLASTVDLPDIEPLLYSNPQTRNMVVDFETLVDAQPNYSRKEKDQLKTELRDVINAGFVALKATINNFEARTARSKQFQLQAGARFPNLLGEFTAYSKRFFEEGVRDTRDNFATLATNNVARRFMTRSSLAKVDFYVQKWAADTPPTPWNSANIPKTAWYEIGVEFGYFNAFTIEFDAELSAVATVAPKDLAELYQRSPLVQAQQNISLQQEVFNQVTFAMERGIEEVPQNPLTAYANNPHP